MTQPPRPTTVTTFSALRRHGVTEGAVRAQLDARRWQRQGHAIVLHNGPLSRQEQWFVAWTHCGRSAALTAFTALEACGLRGWERDRAHVLLGTHDRVSARCPVPLRPHRTRHAARVRVLPRSPIQIPRQAVALAAGDLPSPRSACGLVAAAVQQGLVSAASVREVLHAMPRIRHRGLLLLALADIEQGADALSEIDLARLCRRHRLPAPVRQVVRREASGRRRYLDAGWLRPDGRTLAVEVDGALHLEQRRWWADQARQNELVLADTVLLRYPSAVIRTDEVAVAAQLRRGLLL